MSFFFFFFYSLNLKTQINKSLYMQDDNFLTHISSFIHRFIGELYKQLILTTKIMHRCVRHLLEQNDEDSLECLCKLLTTIGKDLEAKGPVEVEMSFSAVI